MSVTWQLCDHDREVFTRELEDFVPPRVFDAHAHLYRSHFWTTNVPPYVQVGPPDVTLAVYREHMQWILPGREVHALHMGYPGRELSPETVAASNDWVAQEVSADPLGRSHLMVTPDMAPEFVRQEGRRLGMRGLKPYAAFTAREDWLQAEIPEYLPEPFVRVCQEEGWSVTLHLVRSRGLADASNQHWVRHYCETYPDMRLILDHCARGFNPYHVLEGLPELAGLANLWIDTSAVCSATAMQACLEIMGPQRVMYGSDFYVSHMRGTNYPLGDTFIWVDETSQIAPPAYAELRLPLVGIENLRAAKAACRLARLTEAQIEDYFWGNAARLLGSSA
jgi:glutamate-1-semialdehyde 2,1-aminomutase